MSIADMDEMENLLDEVTDAFEDTMKQLFDEDPKIFEGRSSKWSWHSQVSCAGHEFREELNRLVEKFEIRLHNGEFN